MLDGWYVTDPTANPAALRVGSAPVRLIPPVMLVPTKFGTAAMTGPPEETTKLIGSMNGARAFAGGFCEMTKLSGTIVKDYLVTDTKKPEPPGLMLFVAKTSVFTHYAWYCVIGNTHRIRHVYHRTTRDDSSSRRALRYHISEPHCG